MSKLTLLVLLLSAMMLSGCSWPQTPQEIVDRVNLCKDNWFIAIPNFYYWNKKIHSIMCFPEELRTLTPRDIVNQFEICLSKGLEPRYYSSGWDILWIECLPPTPN